MRIRSITISIILALLSLSSSCDDKDKPKTNKSVLLENQKCLFSKLKDININNTKKNGHEITVKGAVETNIKILKKKFGRLEASFEDDIAINQTIETINERVSYDKNFRSSHDAIVQILCSIEHELNSIAPSDSRRKILLSDYDEMRRQYFKHLIGEKKEGGDDEKTTKNIRKIGVEREGKNEIVLLNSKDEFQSYYLISNLDMKGTYLKIPAFKEVKITSEFQEIQIPKNISLETLYLYDNEGNQWQHPTIRNDRIIFSSNNLTTDNY